MRVKPRPSRITHVLQSTQWRQSLLGKISFEQATVLFRAVGRYRCQRWRVLVALLCMANTACSSDSDTTTESDARPEFELVELFRLGDETGADSLVFGDIGGLVDVDGAGRVFVGDDQACKIYVFSPEGHLIGLIGQAGEGPGEFESLWSVYSGPGDSLYAFDVMLNRVSVFNPGAFDLAYTFTVSGDDLHDPYGLLGVTQQGLVFEFDQPFMQGTANAEHSVKVNLVNWQGESTREPVLILPSSESWVTEGADFLAAGPMPFGRDPIVRMGRHGNIYSGWNESIDIAITRLDGRASARIMLEHDTVPVTNAEIEASLERFGADERNQILNTGVHKVKPAYETFVVDDRDRIWLKTSSARLATTAQWLILETENRLRGTVTLPIGISLHTIRAGRAYAIDESGGISMVAFEVREPSI